MKPVYRCEYCDHMGTEDDVRKHEINCMYNYDRKSCWTCKHRDSSSLMRFKCLLGTKIPEGKIYEFCRKYERNEDKKAPQTVDDIFCSLFGGI